MLQKNCQKSQCVVDTFLFPYAFVVKSIAQTVHAITSFLYVHALNVEVCRSVNQVNKLAANLGIGDGSTTVSRVFIRAENLAT